MTDTATGSDHGLAHIDALIAGAEERLAAFLFDSDNRLGLARSAKLTTSANSA